MSELRKAAQQALEALESGPDVDPIFAGETITALRAALALSQPALEPEPEYVDGYLIPYWLRDEPVGRVCDICLGIMVGLNR